MGNRGLHALDRFGILGDRTRKESGVHVIVQVVECRVDHVVSGIAGDIERQVVQHQRFLLGDEIEAVADTPEKKILVRTHIEGNLQALEHQPGPDLGSGQVAQGLDLLLFGGGVEHQAVESFPLLGQVRGQLHDRRIPGSLLLDRGKLREDNGEQDCSQYEQCGHHQHAVGDQKLSETVHTFVLALRHIVPTYCLLALAIYSKRSIMGSFCVHKGSHWPHAIHFAASLGSTPQWFFMRTNICWSSPPLRMCML